MAGVHGVSQSTGKEPVDGHHGPKGLPNYGVAHHPAGHDHFEARFSQSKPKPKPWYRRAWDKVTAPFHAQAVVHGTQTDDEADPSYAHDAHTAAHHDPPPTRNPIVKAWRSTKGAVWNVLTLPKTMWNAFRGRHPHHPQHKKPYLNEFHDGIPASPGKSPYQHPYLTGLPAIAGKNTYQSPYLEGVDSARGSKWDPDKAYTDPNYDLDILPYSPQGRQKLMAPPTETSPKPPPGSPHNPPHSSGH